MDQLVSLFIQLFQWLLLICSLCLLGQSQVWSVVDTGHRDDQRAALVNVTVRHALNGV